MTRCLLLLSALLAAALALCGASPSRPLTPEQRALIFGKPGSVTAKARVTRIPMKGTDHRGFYKCPYFQVKIHGQGPFTFLFDTGASYTAVSSKVIAAARIPVEVDRGGYHDLVRVQEMNVGGVRMKDYLCVRDDDFGVDGVLGFRSFGDMNLVFELARRQMLVSADPVPLPGGFELPYETPSNIPTIPVTVGDSLVATLIDTGDDAYAWEVRTEDPDGAVLAHPPAPAGEVLNGANASATSVSTLASPLRLGPVTVERAVVGINDALPVPDFGVDYLKDFVFEIEPARRVVTFQPLGPAAGTRIQGGASPGFTLQFDDKGTVHTVVAGSGAAQRGMRPGDRILDLGGRPIAACTPRAWDEMLVPGKLLAVRWLKDGTERTDAFEVVQLR